MTRIRLSSILILVLAFAGCGDGGTSNGYTVPFADISVDGDSSDWPRTKPVVRDKVGDSAVPNAGSDISEIYLAQNAENLFIRIDVENGPADPSVAYDVSFNLSPSEWGAGTWFVSFRAEDGEVSINDVIANSETVLRAVGTYSVGTRTIEISVPTIIDLSRTRYIQSTTSVKGNDRADYAAEDGVAVRF